MKDETRPIQKTNGSHGVRLRKRAASGAYVIDYMPRETAIDVMSAVQDGCDSSNIIDATVDIRDRDKIDMMTEQQRRWLMCAIKSEAENVIAKD